MKKRFGENAVSVAEVRDYLDEYEEWDEVLLRNDDQVIPLPLGLNPAWYGDWTSVGSFQTALDEFPSWEQLRIHCRGGRYRVVGLVSSQEPTLIVEEM